MEKKFIVPAVTMLSGLVLWIIFLVVIETGNFSHNFTLWIEISTGLIVGGLIFYSAVRCKKAEGPKAGNIFRSLLLILFAAVSYWRVGIVSASLLFIAAMLISSLTVKASREPKTV